MPKSLYVLLPAHTARCADRVLQSGAIPVIDATADASVEVPDGAWVRARPGQEPPGSGPVWLTAAPGTPADWMRSRDTWLETTSPGPVPDGFAGLVLRGVEAGGVSADAPALTLLAACSAPERVIVHGGFGPLTAGAAMAMGAHGVVLSEQLFACPALAAPDALLARLTAPADRLTTRIRGVRTASPATSPVVRALAEGTSAWDLQGALWRGASPSDALWLAGDGLHHARALATAHGDLEGVLSAFTDATVGWRARAAVATCVPATRPDSAANSVTWEHAAHTGTPLSGLPLAAAIATGGKVAASTHDFEAARASLLGTRPPADLRPVPAEAIAIVGIGCRFPDAENADAYWANIQVARSSIREMPADRWDPTLYWSDDRSEPDKTYAKIGAFLDDTPFDSKRFRIPPRVAKQMDPVQKIALDAAYDALVDAGLQAGPRDKTGAAFNRERCAVILGNSLGGETKDQTALRVALPLLERAVRGGADGVDPATVDRIVQRIATAVQASRPIDEDAMPGELANVIAGRIANALDLQGANFTVDAACASSLAAIQVAVKGLQDGDFDLALTGGSDRSMDPATYVKFAKIGALSADHSAPFDAKANGFVMGEGAGMMLLKRYHDAIADGDRVYAVIRGIGASSDGKGKGITAPNKRGQLSALRRAYDLAGVAPGDVDLIEAHGTSTVVGDRVETEALSEVIGHTRDANRGPVRIGSVKSMIGHLKSAAGAAAIIKTALALHHRVLPPSANFTNAADGLPLDQVPLQVQTHAEPWPAPPSGPRLAGVSAFGFGGTNFHVVLEEGTGRPGTPTAALLPPVTQTVAAKAPVPVSPVATGLPDGVWAVSGDDHAALLRGVRQLQRGESVAFSPDAPWRIAGGAATDDARLDQLKRAAKALETGSNSDLLRSRGVHLESGPLTGEVAFLFPGQGSQYLGMGLDLAERYPVAREVIASAHEALRDVLKPDLMTLLKGKGADDLALLTQTQNAQPAVFTLDVALLRLLEDHGVRPSAVAGHSLGEYAATVAAGIFTLDEALHAVSARGREMADIVLEDPGQMAGVATSPERVDEILAGIDAYVVAANRNCPTQTVIAGTTPGVQAATTAFRAANIEVVSIGVSHAFHSAVVAPATAPLHRVLTALHPKAPTLPITSNVGGVAYPSAPAEIVDLLSRQIASPVSWTDQIEALYAAGVRTFVEVGPKRALSGFTRSILGKRPHRAVPTNHPKRGGVASFLDALAALIALGVPVRRPGLPLSASPATPVSAPASMAAGVAHAAQRAGASQADVDALTQKVMPAVHDLVTAIYQAAGSRTPTAAPAAAVPPALAPTQVVCSGASIGLPGGTEVFAADNFAQILDGSDRISAIGDRAEVFLERNIVRLVKDAATGGGSFAVVDGLDDVIRIAGTRSHFDPRDYGVTPEFAAAMDITSQLAIAAGLEALRDAGIPLVRGWRATTSGKRIPDGWHLPEALQETTGIVFASAFPGYNRLIEKVQSNGQDADGRFDRRLLFQVLAMGHSQLAQLIGARGPNTQINAACASTTAAVAMAEDWLRVGRCERVIVVAADDVTSEEMLPWFGAGFLAAGAATTAARVEDGALPFDKRRHGMILGMGAVGLVMERAQDCAARGVTPVASLLGATFANSAFHGSRLNSDHIAQQMTKVVQTAASRDGVTVEALAKGAMFMSHETYTPARGGSASAEASALRAAFGAAAGDVIVANTKGFTGHAMAAGIEDAVALKAMQYGIVPPIANLSQPDPEFDDLQLSRGERRPVGYAIRLAAGFGSQIAISVWKSAAQQDNRVHDTAARARWLREMTGYAHVQEVIDERTLRVVAADGVDTLLPIRPDVSPAGHDASAITPATAPATQAPAEVIAHPILASAGVLDTLLDVVATHTGYAVSDLDPEFELEADLGIDTVKQAEVLSELRERYALGADDSFRLADHPTLEALAAYLSDQIGDDLPTAPAPTAAPAPEPTLVAAVPPAPTAAPAPTLESVQDHLLSVIAAHTGYTVDDLDPEFELEADLGVDTVKQAEVLSELRADYHLGTDETFRLADHPTIEALADYLSGQIGASDSAHGVAPAPAVSPAPAPAAAPAPAPAAAPPAPTPAAPSQDTYALLVDVVGKHTGYGPEDLDPEFELEADLGVDTVKQAEILSEVRDRLQIASTDGLNLADTPTLAAIGAWLAAQATPETPADDDPTAAPVPSPGTPTVPETPAVPGAPRLMPPDARCLRDLPDVFRARRPTRMALPPARGGDLNAYRVGVLGEGPVAEATRTRLTTRGASLDAPFNAIIDADEDVVVSLYAAQAQDLSHPGTWLCRTALGGHGTPADPDVALRDGARAGFTKALGREWDDTQIRVVDIVGPPALVADVLCDELASVGPDEVFYDTDGRHGLSLQAAAGPKAAPNSAAVVLITGGARGVGNRIAHALAQRGCRLALAGRTAPADQPLDEAQAKANIRAQLSESGARVTPAAIEAILRPLRAAESVRAALVALPDATYHQVDMADAPAVAGLIEAVREAHGGLDVVVHGAGFEESRPVAQKDEATLQRSLGAKAEGVAALRAAVGPDVRIVGMGSVAGRFGNPGQVDYAAANDAMARTLAGAPNGLCLDWTAWDDVGMAVRGGMRSLLEKRGVDLLPADAGAALAADYVLGDDVGEIVIAGRLGGFAGRTGHPLIHEVAHEGDVAVAELVVDPAAWPWMHDHAIDGVPVLAGVVGVEWMAVVARECLGARPSRARDVQFSAPLKVHPGAANPTVRIEAQRTADGAAWCVLTSERTLKTGRVQRTTHFTATFDDVLAAAPLPSGFFPDEVVDRAQIYQRFFHGDAFRVLDEIVGVAEDGLLATARLPADALLDADLMAPLAVEAAFQAAGMHRWAHDNASALPHAADAIEVLAPVPRDTPLSVTVFSDGVAFDIDVDGPSGSLVRVRGLRMIDRGPVGDDERLPAPPDGRPICFPARSVRTLPPAPSRAHVASAERAGIWLNDEEIAAVSRRGTPRRIQDRLLGRLAAKRAVHAATGAPTDTFTVTSESSGEPVVRGLSAYVSISHRAGQAVALASQTHRVGVDLERAEARSAAFLADWFTADERALAGADPVRQAIVWSAKEAVLKLLGLGLTVPTRDVMVCAIGPGVAQVTLAGDAAVAAADRDVHTVRVTWRANALGFVEVHATEHLPLAA